MLACLLIRFVPDINVSNQPEEEEGEQKSIFYFSI